MGLKTVSLLTSKEKYKNIGQTEAKKIISLVNDYSARSGMKSVAKSLGTSRVSVLKFLKKFNKSTNVDKAVRAVRKHFNKGVDPEIQKRYMKVNMQRDKSGLRNEMFGVKYVGGEVRTKGTMDDLNVGKSIKKTGFAQNYKSDKLPDNSISKMPPAGTRPIGL